MKKRVAGNPELAAIAIMRHEKATSSLTTTENVELTLLCSPKTRVVNASKESFDFLGFTIRIGQSRRTGNSYPHVQPAKKSLLNVKDRVTELTKRTRTVKPLTWIVNAVNATVRGWVGYVHYRNVTVNPTHLDESPAIS